MVIYGRKQLSKRKENHDIYHLVTIYQWKSQLDISTLNPWLRATSIMLFLVIPGRIVPFIEGVEITLP